MKFSSWLFAFFFVTAVSCKKNPSGGGGVQPPPTDNTTFTNPLLTSGPDPWVTQKDNFYYYTHTLGNRIALWKTSKMTELGNVSPQTIWSAPLGTAYSQNVWAPEVHFLQGKWYAYFAADDGNNVNHRMYVLENSAADPTTGTWTFKGKVSDPTDKWAIDATAFEHNGKSYLLWSGWQGNTDGEQDIFIAQLSNPWTITGDRVMISSPTFSWEKLGGPTFVNEGPEILKNAAGKVFLIYSASGCWTDDYALGMLTLKDGGDPLNPADWTKNPSPVFTKNPSANAYGPGHNAFFKSKDGTEDWILYHANPQPGKGCGDKRSPRAQKFTWNADGTPNFGAPVSTSTPIKKPSGE